MTLQYCSQRRRQSGVHAPTMAERDGIAGTLINGYSIHCQYEDFPHVARLGRFLLTCR